MMLLKMKMKTYVLEAVFSFDLVWFEHKVKFVKNHTQN